MRGLLRGVSEWGEIIEILFFLVMALVGLVTRKGIREYQQSQRNREGRARALQQSMQVEDGSAAEEPKQATHDAPEGADPCHDGLYVRDWERPSDTYEDSYAAMPCNFDAESTPSGIPGVSLQFDANEIVKGAIYAEVLARRPAQGAGTGQYRIR